LIFTGNVADEDEGGGVGSVGAPPDGCARSWLEVTKSDTDARSNDRAGKLCRRMGRPPDYWAQFSLVAKKEIYVPGTKAEIRVRRGETALKGTAG
jgi:hypothetical protein